jgi:hypothetical protein
MPDGTVRMVYTFNFKYQIGFAGSSATTQMRVVVDHGNQKVITAYPQGFQEGLKTARSFSGSLARTAELLRAIEFIITSEDPGVQVRTRQNGDLFYEYSYPVAIGTTVHGQPTNRIRVVVSSKGDVLRVYPVSE